LNAAVYNFKNAKTDVLIENVSDACSCTTVFNIVATSLMLLWTLPKNQWMPVSKIAASIAEVYRTLEYVKHL
jgi:hypothetical protein